MILPVIFLIITTLLSAAVALFLVGKKQHLERVLSEQQTRGRQLEFEIKTLREIQEKISYFSDVEKIIEVILSSLQGTIAYTAASAIVLKKDKLIFTASLYEIANRAYIDQVKKHMLSCLVAINAGPIPTVLEASITGQPINENATTSPLSYFQIPVIVNDIMQGLIHISSSKPDAWRETEMTVLYQLTMQSSRALWVLQEVMNKEKGKLLAMIGSLADGVFMVDTKHQLLVINKAAKQLLALSKEAITTADILEVLKQYLDLSAKLEEAINKNTVIGVKDITIMDKALELFINPIVEKTRNVRLGASVVIHDITHERNLAQLKEEFTSMVVHELRAPLSAIKFSAQLIASKDYLDRNEQLRLLYIIEEQALKLLTQVSSILDAAKIESKRLTLQRVKTDVQKLIQDRVDVFQPQAQARQIQLTTNFTAQTTTIMIDPGRITQVITNLLSNSLKFTTAGGKIIVTTANTQVRNEDYLIISVRDTGIGIAPEKQKHIFSKFYQVTHQTASADATQTAALGPSMGSGLGLYITKGIVEAHGGTISLQSEVNKGTTITIALPVDAKTTPAPTNSF